MVTSLTSKIAMACTLLGVMACAPLPRSYSQPTEEQSLPLGTGTPSDQEYDVVFAALQNLSTTLEDWGSECWLAPETDQALPMVRDAGDLSFLTARYEANCSSASCPELPESLFPSFVDLNRQRYRHRPDIALPTGFTLATWDSAWHLDQWGSLGRQDPQSMQFASVSRVSISPDNRLALLYLSVHRRGFAWGEYMFVTLTADRWQVLSREWLWSGG